jgi:hypothetical protein
MDKNTLRKIAEDRIAALDGVPFQDLCDRLNYKLYPADGEYEATRAAGKSGDMKCDGLCPNERIFFAMHATRGESASATKSKIESDLDGCIAKQQNVQTWRYMTNDTPNGDIQVFVDGLRSSHDGVRIEIWSHEVIANHIADLPLSDAEAVLDMHFGTPTATDLPIVDVSTIGDQGAADHFNPIIIKNRGRGDAVDCRMSIIGDDYEWIGDSLLNRRDLSPNQETHQIMYKISAEPLFLSPVANLKVVMEYKDSLGNKYVTTRSLVQERVPSGAFYIIKRGDDFDAPQQISE